jgi:hypothetical protein
MCRDPASILGVATMNALECVSGSDAPAGDAATPSSAEGGLAGSAFGSCGTESGGAVGGCGRFGGSGRFGRAFLRSGRKEALGGHPYFVRLVARRRRREILVDDGTVGVRVDDPQMAPQGAFHSLVGNEDCDVHVRFARRGVSMRDQLEVECMIPDRRREQARLPRAESGNESLGIANGVGIGDVGRDLGRDGVACSALDDDHGGPARRLGARRARPECRHDAEDRE